MKIGIINFRYPLYSNGSYLQESVNSLARQPEVTDLYVMASCYPNREFTSPAKVHMVWLPYLALPVIGSILFNLSIILWGVASIFRTVDVINVNSARPVIGARILGFILRKPVVCTVEIINNGDTTLVDLLSRQFQRIVFSFSFSHIICWSNYYWREYLQKWGIDKDKTSIIPCGINMECYDHTLTGSQIRNRFPNDSLVIVFAKPMYDYNLKMAVLLLEAVASLTGKIDIRVILGSGERQHDLQTVITRLKLQDKAEIMPWVPFTEIAEYIAASDMIVLPFTYPPTSSRSLLEGLAMGKALVTCPVGEVPYILQDGCHALLVQPNAEALAGAIRRLALDQRLRADLGQNGLELVRTTFSSQEIAKKTIDVYRNVLTN